MSNCKSLKKINHLPHPCLLNEKIELFWIFRYFSFLRYCIYWLATTYCEYVLTSCWLNGCSWCSTQSELLWFEVIGFSASFELLYYSNYILFHFAFFIWSKNNSRLTCLNLNVPNRISFISYYFSSGFWRNFIWTKAIHF